MKVTVLIDWRLCTGILMLIFSGCSREYYQTQADKEVSGILTSKWRDDFGPMVDVNVIDAAPNDVDVTQLLPPSGMLGLAQAVSLATRYSREYQSEKESLYLSALGLRLTRHRYTPQWFGTIDASYNRNGDTESTAMDSRVGINKEFLFANGMQMSVGLAMDWARFLTGDPQTSLASVLSATVTMPLVGAGAGKAAWENLTQAERNVLYRIRTFNRYRHTFVVSRITDYYRVLQQHAGVAIQEASYQRLITSTDQLRMEVEVGRRPAYDLGEAEQRLLSAEQALVSARQRYELALDTFKLEMALPADVPVQLDPNELLALEQTGITPVAYSEKEALQMALVRRLDLANTRDALDDVERKLILAAEGLGVQLELSGSAGVDSLPPTDFTNLRFHQGTYSLGLSVDLPFDRKAEGNLYQQALIAVQRQQRGYDEEIDRIKLDVRDVYRRLKETAESYRIQRMGQELAQKRVEVEKLSLQYGRGTVRLLLDSEDALVNAQNDLVGALVDHLIAKLEFFRDVGILQVKPAGMWEQKTI